MKSLKQLFLFCVVTLLASTVTFGQWSLGPKAGVNFSHAQVVGLNNSIRPDVKWLAGGQGGIMAEYSFNEAFSLVSEVNYTEKGFETAASYDLNFQEIEIPIGLAAEMRLRYIDVPLIAKYTFYCSPRLKAYVTGGGYFGYGINGRLRTKARVILDLNLSNTTLNLANENFDRTEFGGLIGGGIELPVSNGKFIIDARYSHAYNPLVDDFLVDIRLRNRGFSLGLGYTYTFATPSNKA